MPDIVHRSVLGSCVLGGQIAWRSELKGNTVTMCDIGSEPIGRCQSTHQTYAEMYRAELGASDYDATRARLAHATDLADAVRSAGLATEAVPRFRR